MATTARTKTATSEGAGKRLLTLNTQAVRTAKKGGIAVVDAYEAGLGKITDLQRQAATRSPIGVVGTLVEKQADAVAAATKGLTAPARYLLK